MAKLVRYFHQNPDYWLDHCTLRDWTDIYARELEESPSADDWAAAYFRHQPEVTADESPEKDEGEWQCPFPDETE